MIVVGGVYKVSNNKLSNGEIIQIDGLHKQDGKEFASSGRMWIDVGELTPIDENEINVEFFDYAYFTELTRIDK